MTPRIAIAMPTYEPDPAHLRAAVESVRTQTERDWTLLVHDDASTADVRHMIEPYLADPRVTFVRSADRLGIGGNWNACVRRTPAPFFQFLFQDDAWEPHALTRALAAMDAHSSVGLVSLAHAYQFDDLSLRLPIYDDVLAAQRAIGSGFHRGVDVLRWWIERGLRPNVIGEPSFVCLRRSVIDAVGPFAEDLPQFLDADMWARCLGRSDWFFVGEECGFFRVHGGAASVKHAESGTGMTDRLQAFERLIPLLTPELRGVARAARGNMLREMVGKFLRRVSNGRRTAGSPTSPRLRGASGQPHFAKASRGKRAAGKGAMFLIGYIVNHPLLCTRALLQAVFHTR
ncbi:MAG: family 2 glycosyl transferase [Candidatus Peregrinibacteria bacterium Gr01-1014_25]|nr:MAG: family 2 glycosyl transferase [Candidatus Peregrinibacteria bacterium Gr01-1014_25]